MPRITGLINSKLLRHLDADKREQVLSLSITKRYRKGEQIVRERDEDHFVHFIDRGRVRVAIYSQNGKEVSFTDLGVGENFGELSAIDGGCRTANVVALTNSVVTSVPRAVFKQLISDNQVVCEALLLQLTKMVRRLSARIFEYSALGVRHRIHAELLRLAHEQMGPDGISRVQVPPTHSELASRVSSHREAVSRELVYLEKEQIISRADGKLIICDINRLTQMVNQVLGR